MLNYLVGTNGLEKEKNRIPYILAQFLKIEVKFPKHKVAHIKVYSSRTFNRVTGLCTHHLSLVASHFHHLKRKPQRLLCHPVVETPRLGSGVSGLAPDQGTKFPHGRCCGQKSKKTATTTKTPCSPWSSPCPFPSSLSLWYIFSTFMNLPILEFLQME